MPKNSRFVSMREWKHLFPTFLAYSPLKQSYVCFDPRIQCLTDLSHPLESLGRGLGFTSSGNVCFLIKTMMLRSVLSILTHMVIIWTCCVNIFLLGKWMSLSKFQLQINRKLSYHTIYHDTHIKTFKKYSYYNCDINQIT